MIRSRHGKLGSFHILVSLDMHRTNGALAYEFVILSHFVPSTITECQDNLVIGLEICTELVVFIYRLGQNSYFINGSFDSI